jgi:DNA modification methylase
MRTSVQIETFEVFVQLAGDELPARLPQSVLTPMPADRVLFPAGANSMGQRRRVSLADSASESLTVVATPMEPVGVAPSPAPAPVAAIHQKKRTRRRDADAAPLRGFLFYGDNVEWLRRADAIPVNSIDLVYLDPPFNSNRAYNVLFRNLDGMAAPAQLRAFTDTWSWGTASESALEDIIRNGPERVSTLVSALVGAYSGSNLMAYVVMMTQRLMYLHRVMKPTATIWLHCDPTASHYLRMAMDALFGPHRFVNEVVWKRSSAHSDTKQGMARCGRIHDAILVYAKGDGYTWNTQYTAYDEDYVSKNYRNVDSSGRRYSTENLTAAKGGGDTSYLWRVKRQSGEVKWVADLEDEHLTPSADWEYAGAPPYRGRFWAYSRANMRQFAKEGRLYHTSSGVPRYITYLDEMPGVPLQDIWDDISPALGAELTGFPTQKPLALLERILSVASNPDDVVLDPFCGCGTAVVAAERLDRRWIGIDVTSLAIGVIRKRVEELKPGSEVSVRGLPVSVEDAQALFDEKDGGPHQFQWWAAGEIGALPQGGEEKKGKDRGVDGVIPFKDDLSPQVRRAIVSVKGGKQPGPTAVRDLLGTVTSNQAEVGVLVTMGKPTREMEKEAARAGFYYSGLGHRFPKIQLITVEGILDRGELPDLPSPESWRPRRRTRFTAMNTERQAAFWS